MDEYQAPEPIEVSSFHFSQLRTLKLAKENERVPTNCVNIVAPASKYGLLFVGLENGFKVLKLENILDLDEDKENKSIEENYYCQVVASETPTLITLSSDQKTLAVCVTRNGSTIADMYDIAAFADPEKTPLPFQNVLLSNNGSKLKEFAWNPAIVDTYAFCMSDGSLSVHELSGTSLKIIASLPNAAANAACWSPKGKQIVVGKSDGSFSQYKPNLQEVKNIPPPKLDEKLSVENICWVSTAQFVILYVPEGKGVSPYLFVVSTPKGAAVTYTNFYDVCLGNSTSDDQRYFLHFEPQWGILVCSSTDSIEIAVIGNSPNWVQWDVKEDGKALLPGKDGATHAIGMGVMYCAQRNIVISEYESYPPMPIIFFLTNNGLLISFHMVNSAPGIDNLVRPSTPIDVEGERKRPGEIQNVAHPAFTSQNVTQIPTPAVTSPVMQPSIFHPPVQENKNSTSFISPPPSSFGFAQVNNTIPSEPPPPLPLQQQQQQFISERKSAIFVSTPSVPHPPAPLVGNSFPSTQLKRNQNSLSQPSFGVSAPVATNVVKPTPLQHSSSGNMINKEEFEKQNTFKTAIIEEIQTFEKELLDLKSSSGHFTSIGTKEEMATLKSATLNFEEFQNEMKKTMCSLNTDIHDLKNVLLESFAMVEEANSRNRRKNDHMYISLLKERALCPMTAKRMKKIEQNYIYLNTQIQELSNKIDQDWYEYLEKKKVNQKSVSHLSSAEAIYKTLVNNQNIIHNLKKNLEYVTSKASEKRLENISRYKNKTQFLKKFEPEDLSKLADTFLQTKLIYAEEEKSPKSKKISSDAQAILKNYFSTAPVNTVRPTVVCSPSGSRLISKSMLYKENTKKSDSQTVEQSFPSAPLLPNDTMTKLFNSVTSVIEGTEKKSTSATKFTLPSSPSPKVISSSSVSSSGGPLYEDITPPGSPGPVSYPPETIAILRQLIAQGHTDEETLNAILGAAMRYNDSDQNVKQSPIHSSSNRTHYPHLVSFKNYNNQKENSGFKQSAFNDGSFNSTTSTFGLKNVLNEPNSFFGTKSAVNTSSSDTVSVGQQSIFKGGDFMINKTNKSTDENSRFFSFSQPLTPTTKSGVSEGNDFLTSTQSRKSLSFPQQVSCDITISTSVSETIGKQNDQNVPVTTSKAKSDIQPNTSSTKLSFFPAEVKTLSFFDQTKTSATDFSSFNTKPETATSSTVLHEDVHPSTSSSTSFHSDASSDVTPSLNFSFLPTPQSTLAQSSNTLDNKGPVAISSSENVEIPSSKTSVVPLTSNTSSFNSEVKSSVNSSALERPLFGAKTDNNSQHSTTSSFLFSQLTSPKPETTSTVSFGLVTSTESKAGNTAITSTPSFFGRVHASESNAMTGTTSFLFGQKTVSSESQNKEEISSENAKSESNNSLNQETTLTSSSDKIPTDANLSELHNTTPPPLTTTSSSSVEPSVIPVPDQQAIDLKTTAVSSTETPNISTPPSLFGSSVTSAPSSSIDNSSVTSPPSTTGTTLFGQNNGNAPFFSTPPTTQSSFFNPTNNQKSFFGKTTTETTTTQSSFFTKPPLESASTAPSFFGKTTAETSTFGQNTFAQASPFGASLSSTTATSPTGSFFSQSPGGQPSVFGGNTSENSGFIGQTGGSFSFGKSPFGETQGSFGLAKSVFGQSSTFGQPTSPQNNVGFGQQTGISAFGQGSFFSGLGSKPSEENASKNVFAMGGLGKESAESSVFGSSGATAFGAKTGGFTSGSFSSGGGSVAQSGFAAFQQQTTQKPSGFGTAPAFGGAPSFGSPPAFGSPPSFGSGNALGSVFGSSQQSTNFSNFASANSPTFGSLASQTPSFGSTQQQPGFGQQQSAFGSPSVFGGGSTFGGSAPSFGSPSGGQSNTSAFTQWRN